MRKLDVSASMLLDRQQQQQTPTPGEDLDDEFFVFCEVGPFTDSREFLLCMLDRRLLLAAPEPPDDLFGQGINRLLRLFID